MLSVVLFLIVTIFNPWYWKIFTQNIFVAVILFITTLILYLILIKKSNSKILLIIFSLFFIAILFFQIKTTNFISPFQISSLQKDFQQTRMNEYPPQLAQLSYWLDGKNESIIFFNLLNNFFQTFDFTQYFFSGHFPFIYIPFFFIGIFELFKSKKILLFSLIIASTLVITVVGKDNPLDMFCLYPIIAVSVLSGLKYFFKTYVKI